MSTSSVTFVPGQQVCGDHGATYRILEWTGEGSYARVYRAEGPGGLVAVKLAKGEVSGAKERLLQEMAAHAVLKHPAIPCLRDSVRTGSAEGSESGVLWLARQWVEGDTLSRRLEHGRSLPLAQAVPVLLRIADALAAIHQAGWSHGDVRPQNVMIEASTQHAFLLDLGEARPFQLASAQTNGVTGGERRSLSRVLRPRPVAGPSLRSATPAAAPPRSHGVDVSPQRDVEQLGELLSWSLTGVDPQVDSNRLSPLAGHHPTAVHLWRETRSAQITSAAAFRDQLERLSRQLGLPVRPRRP